ncbi:lysine exporter LysO family protein [Candidatus Micrarchaeota archaeon]|nr:lysine exporter LysO family protein [Candidatus Micrarchaeota archaeon]
MMRYFLACFLVGLCISIFDLLPALALEMSFLSNWVLIFLLFCVGFDLGSKRLLFSKFSHESVRLMVLIFSVLFGSFAGACVCAFLLQLPLSVSLTMASGLGFYTLSSSILSAAGLSKFALIAFMSNFIREMAAMFLTPILSRWSSLAPAAAAGAAADTILPIISKFNDTESVLLSLLSAIILTALVPLLLYFFLGI